MAIVDTALLRVSTSCPTSRLVDAREAISSSFSVTFSEGGHGWSCSLRLTGVQCLGDEYDEPVHLVALKRWPFWG